VEPDIGEEHSKIMEFEVMIKFFIGFHGPSTGGEEGVADDLLLVGTAGREGETGHLSKVTSSSFDSFKAGTR
jgi:hypothetical protein